MQANADDLIRDYEQSLARLILLCVSELPFPLGVKNTIRVLKGAKSTLIMQHDLYQLRTYGLMTALTTKYLRNVINALLDYGMLAIESASQEWEMPVLVVTPEGKACLRRDLAEAPCFAEQLADREVIVLTDEEQRLFEQLRALRREIAGEENVPAYVVCWDSVLRDMVRQRPLTLEALRQIHGVGKVFVEKYGEIFLSVLASCAPDEVPPAPTPVPAQTNGAQFPNAGKPWLPEQDEALHALYNLGLSIGELSASFARTENAIRVRLVKLGLLDATSLPEGQVLN